MKRKGIIGLLLIGTMLITPTTAAFAEENNETLVYGSGDYTRIIRPWMNMARSIL